jgi:hypothetical protein
MKKWNRPRSIKVCPRELYLIAPVGGQAIPRLG